MSEEPLSRKLGALLKRFANAVFPTPTVNDPIAQQRIVEATINNPTMIGHTMIGLDGLDLRTTKDRLFTSDGGHTISPKRLGQRYAVWFVASDNPEATQQHVERLLEALQTDTHSFFPRALARALGEIGRQLGEGALSHRIADALYAHAEHPERDWMLEQSDAVSIKVGRWFGGPSAEALHRAHTDRFRWHCAQGLRRIDTPYANDLANAPWIQQLKQPRWEEW